MLNRVKWTQNEIPTETQAEKQANDPQWMKSMDDHGQLKDLSYNKCVLVFEGEVKQRAFRKWGSKMCESDGEAKEVLARNKLDSLWALAKSTE
jgi:U4/U6 small nuclear ribonucleoprotein PRP3